MSRNLRYFMSYYCVLLAYNDLQVMEMDYLDERYFANRLATLRMEKNVSAREMSLAIGQNPSYINRIENVLAYPSLQGFYYICEYLGVTPAEFFDPGNRSPLKRKEVIAALEGLSEDQLDLVLSVIRGLKKN